MEKTDIMEKTYLLFNPQAGNGKCRGEIEALGRELGGEFVDMSKIDGYADFFANIEKDARIILCGGDGTLNRFVNDVRGVVIENPVYLYGVGTGNDFTRDLGYERAAAPDFEITRYITDLPEVTVNGEKNLFINNVGFGIDGYCCEVGDALREKNEREHTDKPIDYTAIAIKGLLFGYKPTSATVTVDKETYRFKKVWIAPTMNGRYYGGGMMPTPSQDRLDPEKRVSLMVFHGSGKLKTLMIFPSLFKGEHLKHKKHIALLSGREITVEFDEPRPLQIDGETVLGVKSYTVRSGKKSVSADKTAEFAAV